MGWLVRGFKAPTRQSFASTGTTAGYLFKVSTSSSVAVGDTYSHNTFTYTVLGALTAQTGWVLYCTGTGAPSSSGTLTRTSGAGTASIAFTAQQTLAKYTPPSGTKYIRVKGVGGGAGGAGSGTSSNASGEAFPTVFGINLVIARGGSGSSGGTGTITSPAVGTAKTGNRSGSAFFTPNTAYKAQGPSGAGTPYGTGGLCSDFGSAGWNADLNTGAGGSGGGAGLTASVISAGGGAGAYVDAIVPISSANSDGTFYYAVGQGSSGASAGTSGFNGGDGGSGFLEMWEHYQ